MIINDNLGKLSIYTDKQYDNSYGNIGIYRNNRQSL